MKETTHVITQPTNYTTRVLRNAYILLALTLIPTIIGAFIGTNMSWAFLTASPLMIGLLFFACMFGLIFAIQKNKDTRTGFYLLFVFTFFMGITLGPLLQMALTLANGGALIFYAAGSTALTFFGLSAWITATGKDLRGLGQFLFAGSIVILLAIVASLFLHIPGLYLAIAGAIALFSVLGIAYTISNAVHGGETNYVMLTLSLYLDLFNLFVSLLRIFMALSGRD